MISTVISAFLAGVVIGSFTLCIASALLNAKKADYRADLSGAPEGDQSNFGYRSSPSPGGD